MTEHRELIETPIERERVFNGILINVDHMTVRLPDGRTAAREIVVHNGAAAVVAVDDEGYVYLVEQHRIAIDLVTLEIPAGKLDTPDEDVKFCAARELEEETGLHADKLELMTHTVTTPGFCTEHIGLFLATGLSRRDAHTDADEFLGVVRMPLRDAVDMVMRGEIRDMKSAMGLLFAARRLGV